MSIDLRTTQWPPMGVSSKEAEMRRGETTHFVWRRICERCLSGVVVRLVDQVYCAGCYRAAILSSLEDYPPT